MSIKQAIRKAFQGDMAAFTLVEVMVSAGLLAIILVTLFAGLSYGFTRTKAAREDLRATQIMLSRMEGLRLYSWAQLNTNWIPSTFIEYYYPLATNSISKGIPYYGTLTIEPAALNPPVTYSNDMRIVTVTVTWTNTTYKTNMLVRSRSMQTCVGRMGVQNYVFSH